ncbi:MAG: fumarylacetoacetate hydrolase family protein [Hyphomicrobiaceae bacterium]|nr:fumarylacetoacetate hydrolase family protein [Hyphomicrobiaceae bacterium]
MTSASFDPVAAARFIADAHVKRARYENLSGALEPPTIADAYAVQEALRTLWEPLHGPVAGLKIAVTTKVMQELMGIDHPCGGMIYANNVHASPHALRLARYMHVVTEFELAVRVGRTLARKASPWTREEVRAEIVEVMPAFELIEDRNAVYRETRPTTLIADNAWNAGVVLGKPVAVPRGKELNGVAGRLAMPNGEREGRTDDPMGALAWCVNLAADRGRPLEAGQIVITGSVIPTLPIALGETFSFELEGIGSVEISAV